MANISVTGGTLVSDIPVQKERQKVVETISAVNENNVSVKRGTLAMKRVREMVDVIQGGIEAMNQPKTEPEPEKTPFDPDREFSQSFRTDVTPPPEAQTTQVSGMAAPQAGQAATPPQPISSPQFKTTESPSISRPEAEERPTIGQPPIQERPEVEVTELPDTTAASGVQPTDGKVNEPVYREIDYNDPTEVPLRREISKQFDDSVYAPLGKGYRDDQIVSNSYYKTEILDRSNKGNSRVGGDVSIEVQERAMKSIVSEGIRQGMDERQIAMTLAIARHESGFNPDAAAGTTTAHGLGQFVNRTGNAYGLNDENRWIMEEQARALVSHTLDNYKLAKSRNQGEEYVYKYHHDGASKDFGGLGLSQKFVMPNVETYVNFVRQITTDSDRQEEFLKDRGNPTVGFSSLRPKVRPEQ